MNNHARITKIKLCNKIVYTRLNIYEKKKNRIFNTRYMISWQDKKKCLIVIWKISLIIYYKY